ncbi:hypothetical protein, partial [Tenacibaculum maritimum]|uniref:hypothetical protein n=1 Tax=Tenacibaculum maritimum TaxID=107401 RepID=UPI0004679034
TLLHVPNALLHFPNALLHVPNTLLHVPNALLHVPNALLHVPNTLLRVPNTLLYEHIFCTLFVPKKHKALKNSDIYFLYKGNNYSKIAI